MQSKARPCPRCGALNGAEFERCVRCAAPLGGVAVGANALRGAVDATRLLGTKAIFGLTILVFTWQLVVMTRSGTFRGLWSGGSREELLRFGAMLISLKDTATEPYRLLSAVFVHMGILHVALNMLGLVNVGRSLEPAVGTPRFIVGYLTCGVLGFATNLAVDAVLPHRGAIPVPTAGASGAVFGVMGMVVGFLLQRRDRRWRSFAIQAAFYAVVVNLMGLRINNGAHLGGLFTGAALGYLFAARPPPKNAIVANLGAIVGLVLSVLSILMAQRAARFGRDRAPATSALDVAAETSTFAQRSWSEREN